MNLRNTYLRTFCYALLMLTVVILLYRATKPAGDVQRAAPLHMPWDIETHSDGTSSVLGVRLETATVAETIAQLGSEYELAIIAGGAAPPGLEMYYSHFSAGPLRAKLILAITPLDIDMETLVARAARTSITSSGSYRYDLAPPDLQQAMDWPVAGLTLIPAVNLDEETLGARFGEPNSIVKVSESEIHWLFPPLGLDIAINRDAREIFQYVAPRSFERLIGPLQAIATTVKDEQ